MASMGPCVVDCTRCGKRVPLTARLGLHAAGGDVPMHIEIDSEAFADVLDEHWPDCTPKDREPLPVAV